METLDDLDWHTDPSLFAGLPGGAAVIEWFGFVPSFHDWELLSLDIRGGTATFRLRAFRITNQIGTDGFYVLDKHATVSLHLVEVSGLRLNGNASSILSRLRIRQVHQDQLSSMEWTSCGGPGAGDYEIDIETSYGLEGKLFAREISLALDMVSTQ